MVVFSTFTLRRSSMPGTLLISAAAPASATGFHSSPVLGWIFQFDRSGAPMTFCNCGLTSVGTGIVLAGTSSAAGAAVCAETCAIVATDNRARELAAIACERGDFFIGRLQFRGYIVAKPRPI